MGVPVVGSALAMDWQIPLIVSALVFVAFLMWQMRPAFGDGKKPGERARALREAMDRIAQAKDDEERAKALCDAGDACAAMVGRAGSAAQYYYRAMRAAPANVEIVRRAAKRLEKKPHALESLLWRRLGADPWDASSREASLAALTELAMVYRRSLRLRIRGKALGHVLAELGRPLPPIPEPPESSAAPLQRSQ
jgi:hypothetical protein